MASAVLSSCAALQTRLLGKTAALASKNAALPSFAGLRTLTKAVPATAVNTRASVRRPITTTVASASGVPEVAAPGGVTYYVVNINFPSATGQPVAPSLPVPGAAAALPAPAAAPPAPSAAPAASAPASTNGAVPRAKQAALPALATMAKFFPRAMQEDEFMHAVAEELNKLGFRKDNCIALVNTCRDEVCRPIVNLIDREFGLSFNVSGLGGLVNCGKTGFKAAMSHSPEFLCDVDGTIKERYIFFAFPHVSIGETGEVGSLLRRGRGKASSACGALIAIKNDINAGSAVTADPDDAEYALLKTKIMSKVQRKKDEELLSLVQVTKAALDAINEDLEKLISLTVDPAAADYAVITGVQIHSGNQIPGEPFRIERTCDYVAADKLYAVVRGKRYELQVDAITAGAAAAAAVAV